MSYEMIGATVGIASFLWQLWDRFVKTRGRLKVVLESGLSGSLYIGGEEPVSGDPELRLRVTNRGFDTRIIESYKLLFSNDEKREFPYSYNFEAIKEYEIPRGGTKTAVFRIGRHSKFHELIRDKALFVEIVDTMGRSYRSKSIIFGDPTTE